MKKETVMAIFLGIVFGIVVAVFMILRTKEAEIEKAKPITSGLKTQPTISLKISQLKILEITEPSDGSIINKKNIAIKGKVSPGSLVVVQSPIKDIAFKSTKEDIAVDFPLTLGENVIRISVYPKDAQLRFQEKELKVYYLDEQ